MLQVKIFTNHEQLPARATIDSVGYDLAISINDNPILEAIDAQNNAFAASVINGGLIIPSKCRVKVPTGIYTNPSNNYSMYFDVVLRSGFAWKTGLMLINAKAVIDADYLGQWFLPLYNPLDIPVLIQHGQRVAQLIPTQSIDLQWVWVDTIESLGSTHRGDGGFGSTGK